MGISYTVRNLQYEHSYSIISFYLEFREPRLRFDGSQGIFSWKSDDFFPELGGGFPGAIYGIFSEKSTSKGEMTKMRSLFCAPDAMVMVCTAALILHYAG